MIFLKTTYLVEGCFKWTNVIMETSSSWDSSGFNISITSFLIYINQLKTNVKLIVQDMNESADALNNDLSLISKSPFTWKIFFNSDPSKPAQEVVFSRKQKTQIYPTISLDNIQVERVSCQKHLGILFDEKLNFKPQWKTRICTLQSCIRNNRGHSKIIQI